MGREELLGTLVERAALVGVSSDGVERGGLDARKLAVSALRRNKALAGSHANAFQLTRERGAGVGWGDVTKGGEGSELREPGVRSSHLPRRLARNLAPSHCSRPCLSRGTRDGQTPEGRGRPGLRRGMGRTGNVVGAAPPLACGRESHRFS